MDPVSGRADHVVLTAEPETPIDDVTRVLNTVQRGALFVRGRRLAGQEQIGSSDIRDGDVVTVGRSKAATDRRGTFQLAVVSGRLSGRWWPLETGSTVVGRSDQATISVEDPEMSREHFRLMVDNGTCTLEDLGSTNGTLVDGQQVEGVTPVGPGAMVWAGASFFEVRPSPQVSADARPDDAGGLAFNRPARIRPASREVKVTVPAPPSEPERYPFPWVQVIAPLVLAVVGALVFKRAEVMLFALMSPVLAIANSRSSRRRDARRFKRDMDRYLAELAAVEERITEAAAREVTESRHQFPDPATIATIATGPGRRLWERREYDPDATLLRVGVTDRPAAIVITRGGSGPAPEPPWLSAVPVTVDLARAGVLGVAGPTPDVRAVARWLVAQLAVLRSPAGLQLVVLTDADAGTDWEWVRWLPHTRVDDPQFPLAMVGNDKATRGERVKELLRLLAARTVAASESHVTSFTPCIVVIFDGIRALRSLPGVPRLLKEGPGVGIYAIGLDTDVNRLAEEGRAQLVLDPDDPLRATLEVDGAEPVPEIVLDQVDATWADELARGLAPIRDAGGEEGEAVIPKSVRYVDLAGIDLDRIDDVVARWTVGGRTTEALVGASVDGPFSIDLKRDGPHALVAGTTGAGKSEFLQTLVVSLALANRPTAMNFVLIDYKGASAFADCERLPHTVGMVTNLDGHLTERALISLDAELKRRERVLKDLGTPDIDVAWERDAERAAEVGLARLAIVIDEFAELVHELPEFVTGLIRIARVGRSLGVHLILATQRPAGVVSAEMRANTGLRVGLRMEDKADSAEVLEAPHAANISRATPGRGFVRTGGRAAIVEFQTARVAGRRKGATEALPPPRVDLAPWNRLGYPPAAPRRAEEPARAGTDLHALVRIIGAAAVEMEIPRSPSPWLPPLPAVFSLPPVEGEPAADGGIAPVVLGMEDVPALQTQRPATFDVADGGHLLIAGSARSGRSTALRTLAASLARSISPSDVHLYGLDFGNGALLPLADLPHCGGVVTRSETERIERLIARLTEEVAHRQELLARSGFGDIGEQRAASPPQDRLAYLVVLLDRWEGFTSQFSLDSGSELPAKVLRLIREGAGVGLRLVLTGDRSLLTDRIASQVEDKLVLRLADRSDYRIVNINPKSIPEEVLPGQAFRAESGLEVQIALLGHDPSGQAQAAAVREIGRQADARWPAASRHSRPFRVDVMPSTIGFDQGWELAIRSRRPASPLWALVGVGGDELTAFGIDLAAEGGGFVIGGPSKTGRSTALLAMTRSLLASGASMVILCPRPSPLQALDGAAGVLRLFTGTAPDPSEISAVLASHAGPLAIVIDDAETLSRTPADDAVREFLRSADRTRVAIVVAGQLEDMKTELRGAIVEAKKAKTGLLLSPPSTLDGDLVGLRLPRNLTGRMPPGRAILALHATPTLVQVPL
jgi:S-DNA-T family DNA segregation ATPase FtsK/SpoIIIE